MSAVRERHRPTKHRVTRILSRDNVQPFFDQQVCIAAEDVYCRNQIAIQRLAKTYCGEIVGDAGRCAGLFGSCEVDGADKAGVADALYDVMIGANLANQPDRADVTTEIVQMIDDLGCAQGCNGAAGETVLQPGDSAAWPAGVRDGHHLQNRTDQQAKFLVVGTRNDEDHGEYSDIDMTFGPGRYSRDKAASYRHKDGTPY